MDVSALILAGGKASRFGGIAKHELVVDGEMIFARQVRLLAPRVAEILVSSPALDGQVREVLDGAGVKYRSVQDPVEGAGPLAGIAAGLSACATRWLLVIAGDMPYVTGELIDAMIATARTTFDFADISNAAPTSVSPRVPSGDFADTSNAPTRASAGSGSSSPRVASGGRGDELDAGSGSTSPLVGRDDLDAVGEAANAGSGSTSPLVASGGRGDDLDAVGIRSRGLPEPLLSLLHVRTRPQIERAIAAGRFKASRLLTDEGLRVRWLDADPDVVRNINSPEDLARTPGSK